MLYSIFASVAAYIATNIDDMFINMLLFSSAKNAKDDISIVSGKYLGTGLLVAVSMAAARGVQTAVGDYVYLLGIVPLFLGIKAIFDNMKQSQDEDEVSVSKGFLLSTAAVTISSGGDNVGVYVPLLADFNTQQFVVMIAVFAIMTAVWCRLGKAMTTLPAIKNIIEKYRSIITPLVYIALGVYILFF